MNPESKKFKSRCAGRISLSKHADYINSHLLYVLDEHGNEYPVHLLSGEDQWKWHLPEGTYTWKKPQRSTAPGYTVLFSPEAFTLKRGLTTDQVVQVAKQKTSIHWL